MSHKKGTDRNQCILPLTIEEYVEAENPVRLIDEFVNGTNLTKLGFARNEPKGTGAPSYEPSDMVKLLIYGYCNAIRASRKLERSCYNNLEVIWLIKNLKPDHSSIAGFRQQNAKALKRIFREFTLLCVKWELVKGDILVVDGTKMKANNSKKNNSSAKKLADKIKAIDEKIENYLSSPETENETISNVAEKITALDNRREKYEAYKESLEKSGKTQISTTDPDARLMDNKQGSASVGFNIQATADAESHIVLDVKVTNLPTDQNELYKMGRRAKYILNRKNLTMLADKGYYNGSDLEKCEKQDIIAIVPKQDPPKKSDDSFSAKDFKYDENSNYYTCPMGKIIPCISDEKTKKPMYANKEACRNCPEKSKCTTNKRGYKQIIHSEYFDVMRRADKLFSANKADFKLRQQVIEHIFGTVKHYLGVPQVYLRTKKKVHGEVSLLFLAYNIKRVSNILGFSGLMAKLKERTALYLSILCDIWGFRRKCMKI